jgi:hypothetical protein
MIRITIRLLTAVALIVISGVSVAQGWGIVRFFLASMNIVYSEKRAEIVDTLRARSGIISTALLDELDDEINRTDVISAYRQRELLPALLSIKPMSSMSWFLLSSAELTTHRSMGDVLASLKLSMLTGPNEAYVMVKRGVFGLSLWEGLSPDLKNRVANDLVPILFFRTPEEGEVLGQLRALISAEPEPVRAEIREALLATGLSPNDIKQRAGL